MVCQSTCKGMSHTGIHYCSIVGISIALTKLEPKLILLTLLVREEGGECRAANKMNLMTPPPR